MGQCRRLPVAIEQTLSVEVVDYGDRDTRDVTYELVRDVPMPARSCTCGCACVNDNLPGGCYRVHLWC